MNIFKNQTSARDKYSLPIMMCNVQQTKIGKLNVHLICTDEVKEKKTKNLKRPFFPNPIKPFIFIFKRVGQMTLSKQ